MSTIANERKGTSVPVTPVHQATAIDPRQVAAPLHYLRWKRVIDGLMSVILLVPAIPIMGLLVLLVRLTSRGPGIYRQLRVGQRGRTFMMYKIRTMVRNAEEESGPTWAKPNDFRITPVGRIIRKLHLDELPQLFNVLEGEMSMVGPRPERPEFVHLLARQVPGYCGRLRVPPGITGLAQLNLPPDTDVASVRRKLVLDLQYIENVGLFLDLRLLLCTFLRVFKLPVIKLFGLYRNVVLSEPGPSGNGAVKRNTRALITPAGARPGNGEPANGNGKVSHRAPESSPATNEGAAAKKPR